MNRLVAQSGKRVVDTTHQAIGAPHVELTVQFVLHSAPKYSLQPHELQERMSHVFWFQCVLACAISKRTSFNSSHAGFWFRLLCADVVLIVRRIVESSSTDVEKIIPVARCLKNTCYGRTVGPTAYAKRQRIKSQKFEWKLRLNLVVHTISYHISIPSRIKHHQFETLGSEFLTGSVLSSNAGCNTEAT